LVVDLHEAIKALLLLQEVLRGRFSGLILQHQVQALVAAVLLGMSRLKTFDLDL